MQCVQYDFFSPNYGLYDGWGTWRTVQYSTWMLHNWFTGKDDQKKCFWKDIHVALWIDVVWTRWSSIIQNHPVLYSFFYSSLSSNHPGAISLKRCPPTSSDDLCLCFCKVLILCEKVIAAHEQYGLGYHGSGGVWLRENFAARALWARLHQTWQFFGIELLKIYLINSTM